MAVLRLTDVIVPEVFARYLTEDSIKLTTFFRSGILATSPQINQFVGAGGTTLNMPFWQRLTGAFQAIQSNYTITTDKATTSKMVARRLLYANAWRAEELASALSGENAMAAIGAMVTQWMDEQMQIVLIAEIRGIVDDNEDNDSSDLVNDISTDGTATDSNKISASAVIDTYALMGDASDFPAIAMHSVPYFKLVNANLITFEPNSTQNIGFGTYMGMTVIVNDQLYKEAQGSNTQYWTILFRISSVAFGESAQGITPVETDRQALQSEDILIIRRQFAMHPVGFKWIENSVSGEMPTVNELQYAGNWDRVYEKKNCGFVVLKTNG